MTIGDTPHLSKFARALSLVLALAAIDFGLTPSAGAQAINLVGSTAFTESNVIVDSAGNLYGTTQAGGTSQNCQGSGCGTVFEASPVSGGGWTVKVLYTFNGGTDGASPVAGLVMDSSGNLYGTTQNGGGSGFCTGGCGTIFELSPSANGTWTETILHRFSGKNDGSYPLASLIFDSAGNLYGTASFGGASVGGGVVFKLSYLRGRWREFVLYNFAGNNDGQYPSSALLFDSAGNLYGTTAKGGQHSDGTVFMLSPASGVWKETILHDFTGGPDGNEPVGNLALDISGRIYGATAIGGNKDGGEGDGVVYRLSQSGGMWREAVLHTFTRGTDGSSPTSGVSFDSHGNLYGTTDGPYTNCTTEGCGQIFQLRRTNGTWGIGAVYPIPTGFTSLGGLTRDGAGNFFFTASDFHYFDYGDVYELTP